MSEDFAESERLIREAPFHVMWWGPSGASWMSASYADEAAACAQVEYSLFRGFSVQIWTDQ